MSKFEKLDPFLEGKGADSMEHAPSGGGSELWTKIGGGGGDVVGDALSTAKSAISGGAAGAMAGGAGALSSGAGGAISAAMGALTGGGGGGALAGGVGGSIADSVKSAFTADAPGHDMYT
jgi:hypothetical protein